MAQVFPGYGKEVAPFVTIHGGFGGFHVMGSAGFYLDEAEYVPVPTDQIDFTATIGRTEISGDHYVSQPSQVEVGIFLASTAGTQVIRQVVRRLRFRGDPVKDADSGVGETSGEH